MQCITPQFIQAMAEVLLHGAQKYHLHQWAQGMSWETVMAGVQRHIQAFRAGEERDPETGESHLAHAACGLMFLHWFAEGPLNMDYRQFDDRAFAPGGIRPTADDVAYEDWLESAPLEGSPYEEDRPIADDVLQYAWSNPEEVESPYKDA